MTKPKHPELSKREALILSWKDRKDYKGYDKSKGSAFNSWRAILHTAKGQDVGFPDTWREYANFLQDVKGTWRTGRIVCRLDTTKQHSADNSYWAEKGTENSGKLVKLEYKGVTKTLLEFCQELNLNYAGVRQRYFRGKGFTVEEVLFGRVKVLRHSKVRSEATRTARMFGAYRLNDKNKKRENDLTLEYFREAILQGCTYCGDLARVGFDRIDNAQGHTVKNTVPCCYACNCARNNNFTFEEMLIIGKAIREVRRIRNENKS